MARELTIDVDVNYEGSARAALDQLHIDLLKAGNTAEEAARKVEAFEASYKDTRAKRDATKALNDAAAATKGLGNEAENAAKKQGTQEGATDTLTAAVRRYAAPAAIGAAAFQTLNWADNLVNLSKATGISIESLEKFEEIGKQSGVSMEQFANASIALSDRLAGGDKSAVRAMEKLNLNVEKLVASTPDEAMLDFARALAQVENPQERINLGTDAMGRGLNNVLPMVIDLGEKWETTAAKISEDGVKSLDAADDSMDELMASGKGVISTVLVPFAPLLTAISTVLTPLSSLLSAFLQDVTSPLRLESWQTWLGQLREAGQSLAYIVGLGAGIPSAPGKIPGPPPRWGMPVPAGALPVPDVTIPPPRSGGGGGSASGGRGLAPVLQFPDRVLNNRLSPVPAWFNPMTFPGWAQQPLPSGGSPLSFLNGMQLPGGLSMNAPGGMSFPGYAGGQLGGGSWWSKLLGGKSGQLLGGALGMLGNLIPGQSRTGSGIGSMIGSFIPGLGPIGGALGGLLGGGLGRLFGGGEHKKVNNMRDDFTKQFGGTQELAKLAQEAGTNLDAFFKAKNVKDYEKAIADLVKKFDELGKKKDDIAALNDEIASLTSATEVSFDDMQAIVEEFGLDIHQMGAAFKQAAMDKEAKRIIDAFAVMEKGGADMNGVLDGMKDEISELVQQSLEFGTTIPENMRPWIEKLMESGRLVDKDGKAIKDLGGIRFADPIVSEMQKLINKLDELIAKLGGVQDGWLDAAGAAGEYGKVSGRVGKPDDWVNDGSLPDADSSYHVSRGGIVTSNGVRYFDRGGFVPLGTDTVPAMLTPGEMVTSAGATKEILRALNERKSDSSEVGVFIVQATDTEAALQEFQKRFPRMASSGKVREAIRKVAS